MSRFVPESCSDAFCTSVHSTAHAKRTAGAALIAAILGSSMAFIDGGAVNNALPALQQSMKATGAQAQWVVESYMLFLASLVLVGGAIGDRLGRRAVYVAGVVLFAIASLACALSPNIDMLIFARCVQGVAAAVLVPASLALIGAAYDERERGRAIGVWSAVVALGGAVGPILGGFLTQEFSWRLVFFINIPISAAAVVLALLRVAESRDESVRGQPLDWLGATIMTAGMAAIVFALIQVQSLGANVPVLLLVLAAGIIALVVFFIFERHVRSPIVPLSLFKLTTFVRVNLMTILLYAALGGATYFIPFELIQVRHYSPASSGAALAPLVVLITLGSRWAGGLVQRYGARVPLVVGPATVAVGFFLFSVLRDSQSYWASVFPAIVVMGLGLTITVAPITTVAMDSVPSEHVGLASGVNNAAARLAGLVAVALFGIVMFADFSHSLDARLASAPVSPRVSVQIEQQRDRLAGIVIPSNVTPGERATLSRVIAGAFDDAFRLAMLIAAALAGLAAMVGASLPGLATAGKRVAPAYISARP